MSPPSRPLLPLLALLLLLLRHEAEARSGNVINYHLKHKHTKFQPGVWSSAHATFYVNYRKGACGYEDTVEHGYGEMTTALSNVLYKEKQGCGSCYEIKCVNSAQWCKRGNPSIFVTATDHCPPNYALANDNGGWCNEPRAHFDLSKPAYLQIAEYEAGIVPVKYRRVPCRRKGGIRFTMNGHKYWNSILVWNVGGAGDVVSVMVKGNKLKWTQLTRNWGNYWDTSADLIGQSLTFRVTTSDHRKSTSWHVVPRDWNYGQTFEGKNF